MSNITRRLTLSTAALACAGGLVLGTASVSFATTPTSTTPTRSKTPVALDDIKRDGADAIAQREAQLTKLAGRLSSAPNCDAGGKIAAEVAADGPALHNLGTKLAADTTVADAKADFESIFRDYRVYLVVTPQAYVTSACGHVQVAVTSLTKDEATLDSRVQTAAAAGADMSGAETALADMSAKVADATNLANHANATLAAIGPDHGDKTVEASNKVAVDAARKDLQTAHDDCTAAVKDGRTVIAALKAAAKH